jgi:aryl-alcohol dehydrogenase-like predicted oxidoreductase
MEAFIHNGLSLSPLTLGTVQFGMPYGIANRSGQPSYADSLAILTVAIENGVRCFDTAAVYGVSEEVLGRALTNLGVTDECVIVTKVAPLVDVPTGDRHAARLAIRKSVDQSRQRLRLDTIPIVLFHREEDACYLNELRDLADKGWLHLAGVSCGNTVGTQEEFVHSPALTALQVPANLLDRRHWDGGTFHLAVATHTTVFVRSVFLQGILTMDGCQLPSSLADLAPAHKRLSMIADSAGMQLNELALRYALDLEGATSIIVGVETAAQLRRNIAICERGPLPNDVRAEIEADPFDLPPQLITPGMWEA